jgi:hypothetical protein
MELLKRVLSRAFIAIFFVLMVCAALGGIITDWIDLAFVMFLCMGISALTEII